MAIPSGLNNLTNYHGHSDLCDGKAPMEAFVKEAVARGFSSYGFSSHAPLPFPTRWTLPDERVEEYMTELARLKQLYADRIVLYGGMEIDYLDATSNPASERFRRLPLDFRIGSVHMMRDARGEFVDIDAAPDVFAERLKSNFDGDLHGLVEAYIDKQIRMVDTGGFEIVGHADKMIFNAEYCRPGIGHESWYAAHLDRYFVRIAQARLIVEINTKKCQSNGVFFPSEEHFARLHDLNIPVTVNSDAHQPALIDSCRADALHALWRVGYRHVMQLEEGEWTAVPIAEVYR